MKAEQIARDVARSDERTAGQIAGKIVLASLMDARDVVLRDLSRGGAKLLVGDWPDLPRNFYLMLRIAGLDEPVRIECDRRWQVGETIGVRFTMPLAEELISCVVRSGETAAA